MAHNPGWIHEFQQVDIDTESALLAEYSDLVPVIVIDEQVICQHFFDAAKLSPYFRA